MSHWPQVSLDKHFIAYLSLLPLWLSSVSWAAAKTGYSIYDFSATGKWEVSRHTNLESKGGWIVTPSGRTLPKHFGYESTSLFGFTSLLVVDGQVAASRNLYQELQDFSLRYMLKQGYIPKSLYDDVLYALNIWTPHQIRFAIDWIELPREEAERLYEGNIPWDRVMEGPPRSFLHDSAEWPDAVPESWKAWWKRDTPMRILRASLMLGVGHQVDFSSKDYSLKMLPLSWEHYPKPAPEAFTDRSNLPMMAEFSRALAGDRFAGGSLKDLTRILLYLLNEEARVYKVPAEEVLIFAHSLNRAHAKLFNSAFQLRPWTTEMRDRIQATGRFPSELFQGPRTPDALSDRSVSVTTLDAVTRELFPVHDLSSWKAERSIHCEGHPERVDEFRQALMKGMWHHFEFDDIPEQSGPVCIWDTSRMCLLPGLAALFGWQLEERSSNLLLRTMDKYDWDPNAFAPYWSEPGYSAYAADLPREAPLALGFTRVDNISEEAVLRHPEYLRRLVSSVLDSRRQILENTPEPINHFLVDVLNQTYSYAYPSQPALNLNWDPEKILDHTVFLFATTSPVVRDGLKALGGKVMATVAGKMPELNIRVLKEGLRLENIFYKSSYIVQFRAAQMRTLGRPEAPYRCHTLLLPYFFAQVASQM